MVTSANKDASITVFFAEGQQAIREALVAYLKADPRIKVVGETGDGQKVVEACMRLRPKLLVLDLDLQGLNGVSICRALATASVPTSILIFTAHCDITKIHQVLEAGALGFVEKSGSLATLMRAVEAVGEGRAFFGEQVTQLLQQYLHVFRTTGSTDSLSLREREVLQLIAEGGTNKQIASQLGISAKTVENHRFHLMRKLCAHNSADLTREAFRLGMMQNSVPKEEPSEVLS